MMRGSDQKRDAIAINVGDALFVIANRHLRIFSNGSRLAAHQAKIDNTQIILPSYKDLAKDDQLSHFICDAVRSLKRQHLAEDELPHDEWNDLSFFKKDVACSKIINILVYEGMDIGVTTFSHIKPEHRQIARWTFLMLLSEKYKEETIMV